MIFGRILPRLLLGFLLLSPLPLAGLAWLFIQAFEYTLGETVQTSLSAIADKKADQIGAYLDERLADSRLLAKSSATLEALRMFSVARHVEREQRYSGYFRALWENIGYYDLLLANADGDVVFSIKQEADLGSNLNSGPYRDGALAQAHREALELLDTQTALDLGYAPSGGRPAMFIVTPVLDGGAVIGTVVLQLDMDKLTEVASDRTGLGESGETVLALMDGGEAWFVGPLRHVADAAFRYRVSMADVSTPMHFALAGRHGHGFAHDYVGVEVAAAWRYLPALRWGMVVKMDTAEAFAPAQRLRVFTWGAFAMLLLCASMAAMLYGRALVEPIGQLMAATRRIAEGDLKRRAPVRGWQELRELAVSFNHMADRVSADQAMLEQRVDERVRELRRSMALYDALVASISAGVYTFRICADGSAGLEYVSPRFCELLDTDQEAVRRDPMSPFAQVHPDDRDEMARRNREVAATQGPFRMECRFLVRGETRWFHIESDPTVLENGESVWNGVVIDVTERKLADTALAEAAEQTRTIVDNILDGIIAIDVQGIVQRYNRAAERIFGYSAGEVIGQNIRLLMPEPHRSRHDGYLAAYRASGVGRIIGKAREVEAMRKNGELFAIDLLVSEVRVGSKPLFIGIVRDITERKRTEAALQESETRFRSVFERANLAIAFTDVDNNMLQFNDSFSRLLGYAPEELEGLNIAQFIHPDDLGLEASFAVEVHAGKRDAYRVEKRYLDRTGGVVWADAAVAVIRDAQGRPRNFVRLLVDITARKQAEAVLIEAKQAAEAVSRAKSEFLANMSHEIRTPMNAILGLTQLVLDTELNARQADYLRKVHTSSKALLGILNDILDYSKIEAGRLEIECLPLRLEDVLREAADLFGARIEEKGLEMFLDIDSQAPVEVLGDRLRLTQVLNNLVGNAVKFTERGEISVKVEAVSEDRDDIVLRFAVGDTGIGLSKQQAGQLFQVFTQGDGSITRKYGGTGLGLAICEKLVALMGGEFSVSSVEGQGSTFAFTIRAKRSPASPYPRNLLYVGPRKALVVDDQESARRILLRCLNAWGVEALAAASGEEALACVREAAATAAPFDAVLLDWRMPGLSGLDVARRLEDDVAQGRITHPLSIVMVTAQDRELLLAEAGALRFDGVLIKPVTPSLLFDTLAGGGSSAAGQRPATDTATPAAAPLGGVRILLAEDNALNQVVAAEFLTKRGALVTVAKHGGEAVAWVERQAFDTVLMDLHMPVMDGYEATRRIRALPQGAGLPIIAMTAAVLREDRERCAAVGMSDFVAKPIDPAELTRVIKQHLNTAGKGGGAAVEHAAAGASPGSLPGFDFGQALRRVEGDRELLLRLLRGFAEEQADAMARLEALLQAGDNAQAAFLLHTVKGVAGNVGAVGLADAAGRLEREVKAGGRPASLQSFADALAGALAAIRGHMNSPAAQGATADIGSRELAAVLVKLKPYLQEQELVPDELLQALQRMARNDLSGSPLARLLRQIDRFDHDGALASLLRVAAMIGLELPT